LVDGFECSFACSHNSAITGVVECRCDNDERAVTENARCLWQFPEWTPLCGVDRYTNIDQKIVDHVAEDVTISARIDGVELVQDQLKNRNTDAGQKQQTNLGDLTTQHAAALQAITEEGIRLDTERGVIETDRNAEIDVLQAADVAQEAVIATSTANIVLLVADEAQHSEEIATHISDITILQNTEAQHQTENDQNGADIVNKTLTLEAEINAQDRDRHLILSHKLSLTYSKKN
jgi:hypothetical protein